MEQRGRSSLIWVLLAGAALLLFFNPFGKSDNGGEQGFARGIAPVTTAPTRPAEQLCTLRGPGSEGADGFEAVLSSYGASVKHFVLQGKYRWEGEQLDLSTLTGETPEQEVRRNLGFNWRNQGATPSATAWLVPYDLLYWTLASQSDSECVFTYDDGQARLSKTIKTTGRPYELSATATLTNGASEPRLVALAVQASAWRTNGLTKGHMFRTSEWVTQVECVTGGGTAKRVDYDAFGKDELEDREDFPLNAVDDGAWYEVAGKPDFAAVSSTYFGSAVVPVSANLPGEAPSEPVCQMQVEYRGSRDNPEAGAFYRSRLAYPPLELAAGESATYSVEAFIGPKERDLLAGAAGGDHHLSRLIDLGFFTPIAAVIVAVLRWIHSYVPSWGVSIILLTAIVKLLVFPLSIPAIHGTIKMRVLKPEMDALNAKYKDDPQARGLAQMELWRKHGMSPLSQMKGCLPMLATMPIWFALYRSLQTAPELRDASFLWFKDLSLPDGFFILPFLIGATYYLQQYLMPFQGDPAQRKMMLYFMPVMFTAFMFFLPAGLGVYMFTNSALGIVQQQLVERHVKKTTPPPGEGGAGPVATSLKSGSPEAPRPGERRARRTKKLGGGAS